MKRRSIFVRTFSMTATLLLTSFVFLGASVAVSAWAFNTTDRRDTVAVSVERMSAAVSGNVIYGVIYPTEMLQRSLELASDLSGFHVIVTDTTGRVISSSDGMTVASGLSVGAGIVNEIVDNGRYEGSGKLGGLYNSLYYSIGLPVTGPGSITTAGYVFVSVHNESLKLVLSQFTRVFAFVAAAVLLLCCLWAYFYTRRMTRPIKTVAAASREFARGNYKVRVPESARDEETYELSISFNNMAESLEKAEERRREFIANISHELRTPMTSITGYVEGILDGVITGDKMERYLRTVSSETRRLSRLVGEMLEVSRVESEIESVAKEWQTFDLCELARQVIVGQEGKITDKGMDVDMDFDLPIEVYADRDAITRVVYNLVDNAVKYADEDTTVRLSITKRGDKAVFSITDIGKPIPPDERKLIFERFHKTDRSRKSEGLGLGLYLVKNILARHGEDVWCTGEGRMTTMIFTLGIAGK